MYNVYEYAGKKQPAPEDVLDQSQKKNPEVGAGDKTTNFKWLDEATKMIERMLKTNRVRIQGATGGSLLLAAGSHWLPFISCREPPYFRT